MHDTLFTIVLLAIGAGALWLGHWVVERLGADARGPNCNADPNARSAIGCAPRTSIITNSSTGEPIEAKSVQTPRQ